MSARRSRRGSLRRRSPGAGRSRARVALLAAGLWCCAHSTRAVIFYGTGDPAYHTSAPTGSLTNSGWQFQGLWESFLGTAVAPRYFITAQHVGGSVGGSFWLNGRSYTTTAKFLAPDSDLALWRICGTFPAFAAAYTNRDEVGKGLVAFGRGTLRGAPVVVTDLFGTKTNGWEWDVYDGVLRWGTNAVTAIVNGGTGIGDLIQADFDAGAGTDECDLSWGDSGGAIFLEEGSTWKLAAINHSVDGPYSRTNTGAGAFGAALFDQGGLYHEDGTNWVWLADLPTSQPGAFYATRISSHLDWINTILSQPLPEDERLVLQSAPAVAGPYADVREAVVDEPARTITVPEPGEPQFFRLRSCQALTFSSIRTWNGLLVLTYE